MTKNNQELVELMRNKFGGKADYDFTVLPPKLFRFTYNATDGTLREIPLELAQKILKEVKKAELRAWLDGYSNHARFMESNFETNVVAHAKSQQLQILEQENQ